MRLFGLAHIFVTMNRSLLVCALRRACLWFTPACLSVSGLRGVCAFESRACARGPVDSVVWAAVVYLIVSAVSELFHLRRYWFIGVTHHERITHAVLLPSRTGALPPVHYGVFEDPGTAGRSRGFLQFFVA